MFYGSLEGPKQRLSGGLRKSFQTMDNLLETPRSCGSPIYSATPRGPSQLSVESVVSELSVESVVSELSVESVVSELSVESVVSQL
jgi:hypothetical protein